MADRWIDASAIVHQRGRIVIAGVRIDAPITCGVVSTANTARIKGIGTRAVVHNGIR